MPLDGRSERSPGKLPLLLLHGGPGQPSDYFELLEVLAGIGRPVVTYDQIGFGRSDRPADPALWTMEMFVDELGTCRPRNGQAGGHAGAGADPRPRRSGWPGHAGAIPSWPVR